MTQRAQQHMSDRSAPPLVDEQARQWLARLYSGRVTADDRAQFESWLTADAAHAAAYRRAEGVWRDLSLIEALGTVDIESPGLARGLLSRPVLATAAGVLVAVLAAVAFLWPGGDRFATKVAEIRELTLPDGTRVTLGGSSRIDTDFTADRRYVTLDAGEAFFAVVKDPSRPFHVRAGDTLVRVLGTQFDVRHGARGIHVAVSEGMVEVTRAAADAAQAPTENAAERHVLQAGQALVASSSFSVKAVGPTEAGAWRHGRLSYENSSLAEVVADINRYSERPIVFGDESLRAVRITTAFGTRQIEEMLAGLAATHPILIDQSEPDRIVLRSLP